MLASSFDLQGHRGARGLKPENTLPAFEVAFDLGVTSVETDVHLTCDRVPVLFHDSFVGYRLCDAVPGRRLLRYRQAIGAVTLSQLRSCRANRNPCPEQFPTQDSSITPLAQLFAARRRIDPYTPPTLADLAGFVRAYCGELGKRAGKTEAEQQRVRRVRFDLELKRIPFRDKSVMADADNQAPGELEQTVVKAVHRAHWLKRVSIRSFDHRVVAAVQHLEPRLTTAVLVAGTAPVAPAELAKRAGAQVYCPDVEFLDQSQVKQLHAEGVRVVPWTVNHADDWQRLLDWGVDGITTDFPDQLARLLRERGIAF
jgi:glycerophosphoryl diester phosphodiesterase